MSSNSMVFHTSGSISSSPAGFLFFIFLSTELSSSCVNCLSLLSTCFLIILVIGLSVTLEEFPRNSRNVVIVAYVFLGW